MRFSTCIALFVLGLQAFTLSSCTRSESAESLNSRVEATRLLLGEHVRLAEEASTTMLQLLDLESTAANPAELHDAFKQARYHFKQVEFFLAYHYPGTGKNLNGPALPSIEEYDPNATIIDPEGFQVVEELIYADLPLDLEAIKVEAQIVRSNLRKILQYNQETVYTDRHVIESVRLGLVRLLSLGLSGFDSPVAQHSLSESVSVLTGMEQALDPYLKAASPELSDKIRAQIHDSQAYLSRADHDFISFDRLTFVRDYANPLSRSFYELNKELNIEKPPVPKALNNTQTIFEDKAFNPAFFAPPQAEEMTAERISLGRLLFFDPVLSGNNQRSCASCHKPELAFTDGQVKSVAFGFDGTTKRNAPSLINAGLQPSSSYDLETLFLEDRVTAVIHSPLEMQTSIDEVSKKLLNSPEYMQLFAEAFGEDMQEEYMGRYIQTAISDYVRSLYGMNSEFDQYIRGDSNTLDESAKRGFNLFMGKALCGTCHFMPLFTGVVPPDYSEHEAEIIGVPGQPDTTNATIDSDDGRYILFQYELHRFSFKTPTVRNVALTAPYMHNGAYETLEQVVDFYNRGGGAGIGIDLEFQTLPPDHLNLSDTEIHDLVAFMESLTDTTGLTSRPHNLPKVIDPVTNSPITRVVGGVY